MEKDKLLYAIALNLIPGVGSINGKKLIAYTGSIEGIFKEKKSTLTKIPGVGEVLAEEITKSDLMQEAAKELEFVEKFNIRTYFYLDANYPSRLKHCADAPLLLFVKGSAQLDSRKAISIVGTRNATDYGKDFCNKLITDLASSSHNPLIISGLAYGIDITAHKAALKNKLETLAVLAHGLTSIYPATHTKYAKEITECGALVTEFTSKMKADKAFFVRRNRIIAGLADATIVVESGEKGGSLITADIANSYNRDVFALPGRASDEMSKGPNNLIKTNRAILIESMGDLEYMLGWEQSKANSRPVQKELFTELTEEEKKLFNILKNAGQLPIDLICAEAEMPVSRVSPILLNLEFSGIVKSLPGKVFKLT